MKVFTESTRRKMSESAKIRCTEEWRRNKSESMLTNIDPVLVEKMYNDGLSQTEIGEILGVSQKVIWRHMKHNNIRTRIACKRNQRRELNHMWKGNFASYKAFHLRLKSEKGQAKLFPCSVCGTNDKDKAYDWANISGKYEDVNDYASMCRSCHRQYDKKRREVMQNA